MSTKSDLEEAIANCDRDPIHIPGTIQSYGALLATDRKLTRIEFASVTTGKLLGVEAESLLGAPIASLLRDEQAHGARNALSHWTIEDQREFIGEQEFLGKRFQISVHRKDGRAILEFLPLSQSGSKEDSALEKTRALLAESFSEQDFQKLFETAVERLRIQTEYDRVKAYRFLPDGSGEVVAEARSSQVGSFLGLRFPASDIPPIARKLYTTTPIRVLSDITAPDAAILGESPDARPLDLSLAILRGTADVHVEYLKNMGVSSTMTLPIVVDGSLWGLFALHHMTPRIPDPTMLLGAELSGKMLSLVIQHTKQIRHQRHLNNCTSIANHLFVADDSKLSVGTYWEQNQERLNDTLRFDGIAYIVGDRVEAFGDAPTAQACLAVRDLAANDERDLASFDDLSERLPGIALESTAGALVLPLSESPQTSLILFREEVLKTINWAGAPKKEIKQSERGLELNPRNSFEKYSEIARNKSDEWTSDEIEVAIVLQKALAQAFATQQEMKESRHRLGLLVRELNHRVRNILTLVQSLSSNARESATSLEGYASALEKRIIALAGAHDMLTREDMRGVRLDRLADMELRPYRNLNSDAASLSGPKIILNPDVSSIVALLLHELTSNAAKYGALSTPTGKVSMTWSVKDRGLEINWIERGGPPVSEPEREGFGRSIIESAIPYEFGGEAEIVFDPSGVRAKFLLPTGDFEAASSQREISKEDDKAKAESGPAEGDVQRGLIVEDNFVIAREMERWFKELGFSEVVAVSNVANALARLKTETFDFCLLDVNLRGEMSEPIATRLTELGISFVFASGYGSEGRELCNNFNAPFLTKPVHLTDLRTELTKLGIKVA